MSARRPALNLGTRTHTQRPVDRQVRQLFAGGASALPTKTIKELDQELDHEEGGVPDGTLTATKAHGDNHQAYLRSVKELPPELRAHLNDRPKGSGQHGSPEGIAHAEVAR